MSFTAGIFALAGLIAAGGPIVLHLFNRTQFKILDWGPIEFLAEAMRRRRRRIEVRDWWLLILRTLAIALFGLVLARPHLTSLSAALAGSLAAAGLLFVLAVAAFAAAALGRNRVRRAASATGGGIALCASLLLFGSAWQPASAGTSPAMARGPVHLVLGIDNSLSMAAERLGQSQSDRAADVARDLITRLPFGSRVSIVPACGDDRGFPPQGYSRLDEAIEALKSVRLVDTSATLQSVDARMQQAATLDATLKDKRLVYLTDGQRVGNDLALAEDSTTAADRHPVQTVVLQDPGDAVANVWVDAFEVNENPVDLTSPVTFSGRIRRNTGPEPIRAIVSLSIDGMLADERAVELEPGGTAIVEFRQDLPALPPDVDFSFLACELRVAPLTASADRLPDDNLRTMALPVASVLPLLFVDQYGPRENVSLARIGETYALRHLMAPRISSQDADAKLHHLAFEDLSDAALSQARVVVVAGVRDPSRHSELLAEYVRNGGQLLLFAGGDFDPSTWTQAAWEGHQRILPGPLDPIPVGRTPRESSQGLEPFFLETSSLTGSDFVLPNESPESLAELYRSPMFFKAVRLDLDLDLDLERSRESDAASPPAPPLVLGRFTRDDVPFVVEQNIGQGRVVFVSTGVSSDWNTLPATNAMIAFDRLIRRLMAATLPQREFAAGTSLALPIPGVSQGLFALITPSGDVRSVPVEAFSSTETGVRLDGLRQRGLYRLSREEPTSPTPHNDATAILLSVNGPAEESQLQPWTDEEREQLAATGRFTFSAPETFAVAGGTSGGHLWRYALYLMLALLALEMLVVLLSSRRRRAAA